MKQNIATSTYQASRLMEAGVPASSADMCWKKSRIKSSELKLVARKPAMEGESPAWSLSAILAILPSRVYNVKLVNFEGEESVKICFAGCKDSPFGRASTVIEACVRLVEILAKSKGNFIKRP